VLVQTVGNLGKDLAFCVGDLRSENWWDEEKFTGRRFPTYSESCCAFCVPLEEICGQKMIAVDMSYDFFVIGVPFSPITIASCCRIRAPKVTVCNLKSRMCPSLLRNKMRWNGVCLESTQICHGVIFGFPLTVPFKALLDFEQRGGYGVPWG